MLCIYLFLWVLWKSDCWAILCVNVWFCGFWFCWYLFECHMWFCCVFSFSLFFNQNYVSTFNVFLWLGCKGEMTIMGLVVLDQWAWSSVRLLRFVYTIEELILLYSVCILFSFYYSNCPVPLLKRYPIAILYPVASRDGHSHPLIGHSHPLIGLDWK